MKIDALLRAQPGGTQRLETESISVQSHRRLTSPAFTARSTSSSFDFAHIGTDVVLAPRRSIFRRSLRRDSPTRKYPVRRQIRPDRLVIILADYTCSRPLSSLSVIMRFHDFKRGDGVQNESTDALTCPSPGGSY